MSETCYNVHFKEASFQDAASWMHTDALPEALIIERAQTQVGVNRHILNFLYQRFRHDASFAALDLPCGDMEFITYLRQLFPAAILQGGDIMPKQPAEGILFSQMDLSEDFPMAATEQYDLITSVSGIMMFGNTHRFIKNCAARLKKGGTIVVTNDNAATIKDKLSYLVQGSYRIFPPVFADDETLTELVPIQELIRLLRTNGIAVKDIQYTSLYSKDKVFTPLARLVYPMHRRLLKKMQNVLPAALIEKMYPFKHLLCRHYIVIGEKI